MYALFGTLLPNCHPVVLCIAVLLKKSAGSEGDKVDVQKFFGYIGLFTFLGLWWLSK